MAAALPVVASRIGDLDQVVQSEVTGLLYLPGDPAALAATPPCADAWATRRAPACWPNTVGMRWSTKSWNWRG